MEGLISEESSPKVGYILNSHPPLPGILKSLLSRQAPSLKASLRSLSLSQRTQAGK